MKKKIRSILLLILMMIANIPQVQASIYYENHIDWTVYCMRASNITIKKSKYKEILNRNNIAQELTNQSNIIIKKGHKNETFNKWEIYQGSIYVDVHSLPKEEEITDKRTATIVFYMDQQDRRKNYIGVLVTIVPDQMSGGDDNKPENPITPEEVKPIVPEKPTIPEKPNVPSKPNEKVLEGDTDEIQKVETPKSNGEKGMGQHKKEKIGFMGWLFSGKEIPITIPLLGITIHMTPLSLTQSSISAMLLFLVFLLFMNDIRMLLKYKRDKEKYLCTRCK